MPDLSFKLSRLVPDRAGLKAIRNDPSITAARAAKAAGILATAEGAITHHGEPYPDYDMAVEPVGDGTNVTVYTRSNHAKYSNAKHNTLVRAAG